MYATRFVKLLLVAFAIICVAQASWIDLNKIHLKERRVMRRASPSQKPEDVLASATLPIDVPSVSQAEPDTAAPTDAVDSKSDAPADTASNEATQATDEPSKASATAAESTADKPAETTPAEPSPTKDSSTTKAAEKSTAADSKPAETSAPSPTEATDDTQSTAAASATDEKTAAESTTAAASPTTAAANSSKNQNDDTSSTAAGSDEEASSTAAEKDTRTTAKPVTSTHIAVVTRTNDNGDLETMTTTSVSTSTPGLSDGDDDGSSSGMSTKTRNTVIGVVVGIGGAIVVGALGLVAWRIWGRKKHNEEADGLMDFDESNSRPNSNGPYHSIEKTEYNSVGSAGPQRSPFASTLENYHQPTPVNASSNF